MGIATCARFLRFGLTCTRYVHFVYIVLFARIHMKMTCFTSALAFLDWNKHCCCPRESQVLYFWILVSSFIFVLIFYYSTVSYIYALNFTALISFPLPLESFSITSFFHVSYHSLNTVVHVLNHNYNFSKLYRPSVSNSILWRLEQRSTNYNPGGQLWPLAYSHKWSSIGTQSYPFVRALSVAAFPLLQPQAEYLGQKFPDL